MGCNDSTSCNHGTTQISQIYCTIAAREFQVPGIFMPKTKQGRMIHMTIAWAYCRFSSDHQREESIDAQIRAISAYCERENIILDKIYRDEAKSATTDDRPGFQQMFKDIKDKQCDIIIVHKLDRFSRDRYDSAFYKRKLKEQGIRLVSVLENIDGSPESIILESVLEGMSEYYSRNLAREVQKGKKETAYQCRHNGGVPPLGYDVDNGGHYHINPIEAAWVTKAYEMKASGRSYMEIADYLNSIGAKSKRGGRFTKHSFHDLFKNEKYKGVYVYNRTESKIAGKRNNHKNKADDDIIRIEDGIPRIISDELWNKVNRQMGDRSMNARHKAKRTYLLSGIIYCGECGSPMSGNSRRAGRNKTEYVTYDCNRRHREKTCKAKAINKKYIEDIVVKHLAEEFFTEENVRELAARLVAFQTQRKGESEPELLALKKELSSKEKELQHIIDSIKKGGYKDWMGSVGDQLDEDIKYLKGKIEYLDGLKTQCTLTEEQVYDYIMKDSELTLKTPEDLKHIVQTYVEKVLIFNDKIEIHLIVNKNNPGSKCHPDCGYDGGDDFFRFITTIELLKYRHKQL